MTTPKGSTCDSNSFAPSGEIANFSVSFVTISGTAFRQAAEPDFAPDVRVFILLSFYKY